MGFALRLAPARTAVGPAADTGIYRSNLKFLRDQVLPEGWRLTAVQKWNAHGHGIEKLAPAAVAEGAFLSVLYNREAAAAARAGVKRLLRIKPASYEEALEAAQAGWGLEELVGPDNVEAMAAAAGDAGTTIGVHVYLFEHYGDPWGWDVSTATQLLDVAAALGPRLRLRGIMTHLCGYAEHEKPALRQRFLSTALPAAQELAGQVPAGPLGWRTPLALHWVDSSEALRLLGEGGRIALPRGVPTAGSVPGVEWWARLGKLTYGSSPEINTGPLRGGVRGVMRWSAIVTGVEAVSLLGQQRLVARVELQGGRYPTPAWWAGADAYAASSLNQLAQPAAYVAIRGKRLRLARVPRGAGRELLVDVTGASPPVRPGDEVCLLGDERGLKDLANEMGADDYNVAFCLRGQEPVEGSDWWPPACVGPF